MLCLQRALVPEATGAANAVIGCDALWTLAISTHAMCYVDSGLCILPPSDWVVIDKTVTIPVLFENTDARQSTL
jgi:hypothetical protein